MIYKRENVRCIITIYCTPFVTFTEHISRLSSIKKKKKADDDRDIDCT